MLTLLLNLLSELFICRPTGLDPGTQSTYAKQALAELDSRYFGTVVPQKPSTTSSILLSGMRTAHYTGSIPTTPSALDTEMEWSCS